jgi:hypothetical protein
MKVAIGTYVSDGARRSIDVGFEPKQVYIKGDTTQNLAQRAEDTWCARSNVLGADDSYLNGIGFFGDEMHIGTAAEINTNTVRYYWCAIGDDGSDDFDLQSWMGNATAGRVVDLAVQKTPIAAIVKRDSTAPAAVRFAGAATAAADGTAIAECFSALSAGSVTLNNVVNVNEYTSGGFGEGIDGLFVFDGSNARVVSWASGTSGQFIDCGCDPLAAFIFRTDTTGVPAHFVTRDMHDAAPITNVAIATNTATLAPGGIVLGSSATLRTGTFYALVFGRREGVPSVRAPAIIVRERKGVYLPGRGVAAQVDCGTSDATLKIDGAITVEWYGIQWADQYSSTVGVHLLQRGVGPSATVGAYSWGLAAIQVQDFSWSGPQLAAITTNQWAEVAPLEAAVWRTGAVMPWGRPAHVMAVHEGNGSWKMYLNGRMVKQRRLDLSTDILSGTGHRTGFGMRRNTADTAWTQAQRMVILSGRVYAAALSADQVAKRFAREALGSSESDVVTGLAESWDARNASGLLLPASVNSANNGTISAAGRVVTL